MADFRRAAGRPGAVGAPLAKLEELGLNIDSELESRLCKRAVEAAPDLDCCGPVLVDGEDVSPHFDPLAELPLARFHTDVSHRRCSSGEVEDEHFALRQTLEVEARFLAHRSAISGIEGLAIEGGLAPGHLDPGVASGRDLMAPLRSRA